MKQTILKILLIILLQIPRVLGQTDDSLLLRLQGTSIDGAEIFNVDGVHIIKESALTNFSNKNFYKKFKGAKIEKSDLNYSDSTITLKNYCVSKSSDICIGVKEHSTVYFIQTYANQVIKVSFTSFNKRDIDLERNFLSLLLDRKIPSSIFNPMSVGRLNFAGRLIPVGGNCRWRFTNNVQCSGNGQMDWSIHKTLDDAKQTIEDKFLLIKSRDNGKVVSEEFVDVVFEDSLTKARKIIFDFTGVTSALVGMTGGKTLTVYLVSTTIRGFKISCTMSYWNNDYINQSGLPTLLDQVMVLQK